MNTEIKASDHTYAPTVPAQPLVAPSWWPTIEQDYIAVQTRRDTRFDSYQWESAEDRARHQRVLNQGAALVRHILELMEAEPIPAVREAAVRYLLNRDFSFPALLEGQSEDQLIRIADTMRQETHP